MYLFIQDIKHIFQKTNDLKKEEEIDYKTRKKDSKKTLM